MADAFLMAEIAGQRVAFDVAYIQGVMPVKDAVPVAMAPVAVTGIVSRRGQVNTVVDTRLALGLEARPSSEHGIVVTAGAFPYLLIVDVVYDVISIDGKDIAPPSADMMLPWTNAVRGVVDSAEYGLFLIIDVDCLVEHALV